MKHEEIKASQRELAREYEDCNPSEVTEVFWLYAERTDDDYPDTSERSGKYLLYVAVAGIDEVWQKIRVATEKGLLGGASKVATSRPNRRAKNDRSRVICVYTYDGKDEPDRLRVRKELRKLGFEAKIPYKFDSQTMAGEYATDGKRRVSKYYE